MLITIASIPLNMVIDLIMKIIASDTKPGNEKIMQDSMPSSCLSDVMDIDEQKNILYERLLIDIKHHRMQLTKCKDFQSLMLFDLNWKYVSNFILSCSLYILLNAFIFILIDLMMTVSFYQQTQ